MAEPAPEDVDEEEQDPHDEGVRVLAAARDGEAVAYGKVLLDAPEGASSVVVEALSDRDVDSAEDGDAFKEGITLLS